MPRSEAEWVLEQAFPVEAACGDDDGYKLKSAACVLGDGVLVIAKQMQSVDGSTETVTASEYKSVVEVFEFGTGTSSPWRPMRSFATPRSLYFQLTLKISKNTNGDSTLVAACDEIEIRSRFFPGAPKGGDSVLVVTDLLNENKDTNNLSTQLIFPPQGCENRHWFGRRNDMDGRYLIIGDDDFPEGNAHIYELKPKQGTEPGTIMNAWEFCSTIRAPRDSRFGKCVAIDGQSGTAVVAADRSVCIFTLDNECNYWKQEARIQGVNYSFGSKIALDADTLVIGEKGAVHVYIRSSNTSWMKQACLKPPPEVQDDSSFGAVLSLDCDTLIVGCYFSRYNEIKYAGAACIFERTISGDWSKPTILRAPRPTAFGRFGRYVDVRGDRVSVGTEVVEAAGIEQHEVYTYYKI